MKTKPSLQTLRKLAQSVGATFEEDTGYRDMRRFQLVAPDGKRWAGTGCVCHPLEWATRHSDLCAETFNAETIKDAEETVKFGLEDIPEEDKYLYDEGPKDTN